jgi:arginase family enzyme
MTSTATRQGTALVGMRCRTAERNQAAARGVGLLAEVIGDRVGVRPRLIGSPEPARTQAYGEDLTASRGCLLEAGGQIDDALHGGAMPVLVAGDGAVALSTLPVVARLRPDARVLWLDAHGAFHTPQTTSDEYLGGMALAGACGCWGTGFEGAMPGDRVVLCGVRELDAAERDLLRQVEATVIGTTLETLVFLQNALDGAPTYVHLDLDVLDPDSYPLGSAEEVAPSGEVGAAGEGGVPTAKLLDLLDAVADSCEIVGLELTGFLAPEDEGEARRLAETVTAAIDPLLH